MTAVLALLAHWGLPEWLRKPLAYLTGALAVLALLWLFKGCYDDSVIDDHEAEVTQAVAKQSAAASTEAAEAVSQTKNGVEKTNAEARNAAARSSDPLRDGLGSLRTGQGKDRPASR